MEYKKTTVGWVVKLEKGEELMASLVSFCKKEKIRSGMVWAIGGALEAELSYYNLEKEEYETTTLDEVLEIASLIGNISLKDGEPFPHLHVVLGDKKLKTHAGHLSEATVSGTCEIVVLDFHTDIARELDPSTGLSVWDLGEEQ